jgi:hypothetical protein
MKTLEKLCKKNFFESPHQIIYIEQKAGGVTFVDVTQKLLADFDNGKGPFTMDELAW